MSNKNILSSILDTNSGAMIDLGPVVRNWVAVSLPKNARYWQPNIPVDNSGLIIQGSIESDFILHVEIADTMGILCQDNVP